MTANKAGISAFDTALTDIRERHPFRTLRLTPPSQRVLSVPGNRGARIETWPKVHLEVCDGKLKLSATADALFLQVGREDFALLRKALVDIENGGGDRSISGGDQPLWCWWCRE